MTLQNRPSSRNCTVCERLFTQERMGQHVCGQRCSMRVVAIARKAEAKVHKSQLEKLKTIADRIAEAQKVFNAFIRLRDKLAGHACISSGRALDWTGNAVDAGHYRSTGAASHLRFNEANCHAQSKHDNRYLSGNAVDYRINLVKRIGLDRVEALEADNVVHKWTHDELIAIKATYTAKTKQLKAAA